MQSILPIVYAYLRSLWRSRWLAVAIAWIVCVLIWLVVLVLPDRFEASAKVYVDARTPLRPVLEGIAIEADYESQLTRVREALLSRPQLEAVARRTNLDANVKSPEDMQALIARLQNDIAVISTATRGQDGRPSGDTIYSIVYGNSDREMSLSVVRTLLDNFVEGTLAGSQTGSGEAQDFLGTQIRDLERRLAEAEARLAEFKKRNLGMLPGEQRGDYFSRLEASMMALQQTETNLAVAASRREELRRQLAAARQYVPGTASAGGGGGSSGVAPDVSTRVQEAEARLEELLLRFTEKHPEVVALKQTILELKDREAKELAELARGGSGTGSIRSLNVNPVYQQIQSQLSAVEVELASLRGAAVQHQREIAELRRFVDSAPEVEQEYARLNRDYGVTKAQYEQLVARLEQAKVTDDAAKNGIVRFEVIEPPRADIGPVGPPRALLMLVGLLGGLGAGVAVALVPALLRPTFSSMESLSSATQLPVLGSVSALRRPEEIRALPIEVRRVVLAVFGLAVVSVGLMVVGSGLSTLLRSVLT